MLIFLYGNNTYFLNRKLREIIDYYQEVRSSRLNLHILEANEIDFDRLRDILIQATMFKERRLVVLKNIFLNKKLDEEILKNKKLLLETSDIIVFTQEGDVDKKNSLFEFLKDSSKTQYFDNSIQGMVEFLIQEFKKRNIEIDRFLAMKLASFVGNDFWLAEQEVRKISNLNRGERQLSNKHFQEIFSPLRETKIYRALDFLVNQRKKEALETLANILNNGESPFLVLGAISAYFRRLIIAKINPLFFNREKISPRQRSIYITSARRYSLEKLKNIYQKILRVEIAIKQSQNPTETLLMFFATF